MIFETICTTQNVTLMTLMPFDEGVVETFRCNKIDGETFLELTSADLKELGIVALGDRKKLGKLMNKLSSEKVRQII